MKRLLTAMILGAVLASCVTNPPRPPKPPVDNVPSVRDQATILANATKAAFTPAINRRNEAQALYDAKKISAAVMQRINDAGNQVDISGQKFITFAETVTTDHDLRTTAEGLFNRFREFTDALAFAGVSGSDVTAALAPFMTYLQ